MADLWQTAPDEVTPAISGMLSKAHREPLVHPKTMKVPTLRRACPRHFALWANGMQGVPCAPSPSAPRVDNTPAREHTDAMKVRTSITLPQELLRAVDRCARQQGKTRSNFVEAVLRTSTKRPVQDRKRNARDLEIINRNADSLNREASDVLEHQVVP